MTNPQNLASDLLVNLSQILSNNPRMIDGHRAKILIIGTGAFGTALAFVAINGGCQVTSLSYEAEKKADFIHDPTLSQAQFEFLRQTEIDPTSYDLIILAVASQALREVATWIKSQIEKVSSSQSASNPLSIICAAKGIERGSLKLPSQVLKECLPENTVLGSISGPSFAKELRLGLPAALVVASENQQLRTKVKNLLHRACFRIYDSADPIGIEVAGALKNVIAIVAGGSDGLGLGENARAAVVTRGFSELIKIGVQLGADPITFLGLGGLGDLFLTAASDLSRNRQLGVRLAKGETRESIISNTGEVIEGIATTESAYHLAKKYNLDTPVINVAYGVIYENLSVPEAILSLITRQHKSEFDWISK